MKPLLHPVTRARIENLIAAPTGAVIFSGSKGIGKTTTAVWVAAQLNCLGDDTCRNCRSIGDRNYPDLINVSIEGKSLGIEQVQLLRQSLELSRYYHMGWRVVVIEQAELLTAEAQNALLKLLEEPPQNTMIVLATTELSALLPTVISRSQAVNFLPPAEPELMEWLKGQGASSELASTIVALGEALPGLASELINNADSRGGFEALDSELSKLSGKNLLERLTTAAKLSELPDPSRLAELLSRKTSLQIRLSDEPRRFLSRLQAIERFEKRRRQNVNVKAALEALALEL